MDENNEKTTNVICILKIISITNLLHVLFPIQAQTKTPQWKGEHNKSNNKTKRSIHKNFFFVFAANQSKAAYRTKEIVNQSKNHSVLRSFWLFACWIKLLLFFLFYGSEATLLFMCDCTFEWNSLMGPFCARFLKHFHRLKKMFNIIKYKMNFEMHVIKI